RASSTPPSAASLPLFLSGDICPGISGNLMVVFAILRKKEMREVVTNLFILNLAISDIVMCLFAVPFTPLQTFTGGLRIHFNPHLTIIAVDRFVVINYPFRARMQVKTCICLILIIDLLACIFTAPYAVHISISPLGPLQTLPNRSPPLSQSSYATNGHNTSALISLRESTRFALRTKEEQERSRNLRINRMLISMVIVFGTCWLPLNTINFIGDLNYDLYCWEYHHIAFFICHVMAMSSTVYNPFLYGWYNDSFQKSLVFFPSSSSSLVDVVKRDNNDNNQVQRNKLEIVRIKDRIS
ncbi:Neuropeptide receptor A10, partial [Caligus rogercresseyi]